MDARLHGRIDASDVLRDGFLDLVQRVDSYRSEPSLPVFLWLGRVVSDWLAMIHRHHFGTQMRDVSQEVSLYRDPTPIRALKKLKSILAAMPGGREGP
jgi:hypothetical protein